MKKVKPIRWTLHGAPQLLSVACFLFILSLLTQVGAQSSKLAVPIEEAIAGRILKALPESALAARKDIIFHVFRSTDKLYVFDKPRNTLYEVRGGTLDEFCTASRPEALLLGEAANVAVYGEAASSEFVSRAHFPQNYQSVSAAFLVPVTGKPRPFFDVVASTGQRARVHPVEGYPSVMVRASTKLDPDRVIDLLRRSPLSADNIHVLLYYRDTHVEEQLKAIPGVRTTVIPEGDPQLILRTLNSSTRKDIVLILGHNESGFIKIRNSSHPGISLDSIESAAKEAQIRSILWSCEAGSVTGLSGPRYTVYIEEAVERLATAAKQTNILDAITALDVDIIVDETLAETHDTKAEEELRTILGTKRTALPALVIGRRSSPARNPDAGAPNAAGTSEGKPDPSISATPSRQPASDRPVSPPEAQPPSDTSLLWKLLIPIVGILGGALLYAKLRPKGTRQ